MTSSQLDELPPQRSLVQNCNVRDHVTRKMEVSFPWEGPRAGEGGTMDTGAVSLPESATHDDGGHDPPSTQAQSSRDLGAAGVVAGVEALLALTDFDKATGIPDSGTPAASSGGGRARLLSVKAYLSSAHIESPCCLRWV